MSWVRRATEAPQGKAWAGGDIAGDASGKTVCARSWKVAVTTVAAGLVIFSFALQKTRFNFTGRCVTIHSWEENTRCRCAARGWSRCSLPAPRSQTPHTSRTFTEGQSCVSTSLQIPRLRSTEIQPSVCFQQRTLLKGLKHPASFPAAPSGARPRCRRCCCCCCAAKVQPLDFLLRWSFSLSS